MKAFSSRHVNMNIYPARLGVLGALIVLSLLVPAAAAQSQTDGSIYSRFGLGQREFYNSPRAQAMGGGGLALRSVNFTNHANPASLSDQVFTRFAGGLTFEGITESADGFETSRAIWREFEENKRPFIIAMTAHAMWGDRERCLEAGMDAYVSKPVDIGELRSTLAKVPVRKLKAALA